MLIEHYLPNISDPVYSVHQSFMWFLWLNWRKSTFYPVTAPNDSKCWPIVTSSIQEPAASNCDVTMTDCSRVVAMDAFLAHWCRGQWFKEYVKGTSVPNFSTLWKKNLWSRETSDVIIDWPWATRTGRIMALIMVQRQGSKRTISDSCYHSSDELCTCLVLN